MRLLRADDGFSLSELVVVVALLGGVLSVAFLGYSISATGSRTSDRASMTAMEVSAPLLEVERRVGQQHNILTGTLAGRTVNPGGYLLAFYTNSDNDNHTETNIIEATTDGRLVFWKSEAIESPTLTSFDWSTDNVNRDALVPLFTYYDASGAAITDTTAIAGDAASIKITIVTEHEGVRFTDSRTVYFRN